MTRRLLGAPLGQRTGWLSALAIVLLLLGPWPSAAFQYHSSVIATVVFQTSVPTDVYQYTSDGLRLVGHSGDRLNLSLPGADATVTYLLRRQGYRDETLELKAADLLMGGQVMVPDSGPLEMVPLSPWVPMQDFWSSHQTVILWGSAILAFLIVVYVLPSYKRLVRKARVIRRLIQKDPKQPDANVGKYIGRYLLVRALGIGGAAAVYEAVPADEMETGEHVAIKVLHGSKVSVDFRDRFVREVNICKALNHPNLVRLLDWEMGSAFYLVMELVEGQSLRRYMTSAGMKTVDALAHLQGVFSGLNYAHKAGVVHCDLKPDNIMITPDGQPRIMDFGIATGRSYQKLTQTTDVLGTPGYIAPEQMDGVRDDPRSDQYALGVIIFEMLAGRRLFDELDPVRLITMHLIETPPRLCDVKPGMSEALSDVIDRMISKKPEDRYPNLQAAWEDLLRAASLDRMPFDQRTVRISSLGLDRY